MEREYTKQQTDLICSIVVRSCICIYLYTHTHIFLKVKGSLDQFCLERAVKVRGREAVS